MLRYIKELCHYLIFFLDYAHRQLFLIKYAVSEACSAPVFRQSTYSESIGVAALQNFPISLAKCVTNGELRKALS